MAQPMSALTVLGDPQLSSQHPHGSLKLPIAPVPGS